MTANRSSRLTFAATCAIPIECEHGWDVCPICDTEPEPVTDPAAAAARLKAAAGRATPKPHDD